jgi:flagellar biosynthesis anti-sigma factor FlgM
MTTMRIGASYTQTSTATQAADKGTEASKGQAAAGSSAESPSTSGAATVTLSAKARELGDAQSPEASEKVQRLRSQVESGQLLVDPSKIAAALIGD